MRIVRMVFLLAASAALGLVAGCATGSGVGAPESAARAAQEDAERLARIRLQLAVGYYQQGQSQTALDELRRALQADPRLADAYSLRGLIQMDMDENRQAEESFQQALKLAPNSPDYNNNYGWFLCQTGRERQSLVYFENAARERSYRSPAKAYSNAGVCSLRLKDAAAAERYFNLAYQIEPGHGPANLNLARLLHLRGDNERARFHVSRLLKTEDVSPEALLLAIRIERKLENRIEEERLAAQLRRVYPDSAEFAAYQRGTFDE